MKTLNKTTLMIIKQYIGALKKCFWKTKDKNIININLYCMHPVQMPKNCPICGKDKISKPIQQHQNNDVVSTLFECDSCNVQFWEPFKGAGKEWYEENNALSRIDILKPAIEKSYHKEFLKRHKDLPKNTKIIDFGCGTGALIGVLRKKGYDVWGVDVDEGAVRIARRHFGDKNIYGISFE